MDLGRMRSGSPNEEANDNTEEIERSDIDMLSVGSCHLEEEEGDGDAMVAVDSSVPGPSQEGEVDKAGWGEISIFFSHRRRREKRKNETAEDIRRSRLKSSAKRIALGLTVGEELMNDIPAGAAGEKYLDHASSTGSIVDAQLQQILVSGRIMTRWHCTLCPKDSEVYDTLYGLSARLHAVHHLGIAHGKDTFQLMALRERARIQRELKMVLKFELKTQDDVSGLSEDQDPVEILRINNAAVTTAISKSLVAMSMEEVNDEAADLYTCFCYKTVVKRESFIHHLAEDHDIFLSSRAEASGVKSNDETANREGGLSSQNEQSYGRAALKKRSRDVTVNGERNTGSQVKQRCTQDVNRDIKNLVASLYELLASDSARFVRWKCRFCPFFRISKSYTLHLRVIYHLISCHSSQIQDPLIDRAIGENMILLEKELGTKPIFLPRTQADIRGLTNYEDCINMLCVTDEKIVKFYEEANEGKKTFVCFCYAPYFYPQGLHKHLEAEHGIIVLSRTVSRARESRMKRLTEVRLSSVPDKKPWKCFFCQYKMRPYVTEDVADLLLIYHLVNMHNSELREDGRITTVEQKINLLEEKLKTKLSFLPRTQADIDGLPNTEECVRRLSITDEKVIKMYEEVAETSFSHICFCYEPVAHNGIHQHLKDTHGIEIPVAAVRGSEIIKNLDAVLFKSDSSHALDNWNCLFCETVISFPRKRYNTANIIRMRLIYHLITFHNDKLLATGSRIVIDKKIKELEETMKTKLVFLSRTEADADGLTEVEDCAQRLCITDERIVEYYKKAWMPSKNERSVEAATDRRSLKCICFCYVPIFGGKQMVSHLKSAHEINISLANPRNPGKAKLIKDALFKSGREFPAGWYCIFCGSPLFTPRSANRGTISLRIIYHLVIFHNDELLKSGSRIVVDEKTKSLEEELGTKLLFLAKTQADLDGLMDVKDCIEKLVITDEKVLRYYLPHKVPTDNNESRDKDKTEPAEKKNLSWVCFCYFPIFGNGLHQHLSSVHAITLPVGQVRICNQLQSKDYSKQEVLKDVLLGKRRITHWKCIYCGTVFYSYWYSEDVISLRLIFHLISVHDRELNESRTEAIVDEKVKLLEAKLKTKLVFSPRTQADIGDASDVDDCFKQLSITNERVIDYYRKVETANFLFICFCYSPLHKRVVCSHMRTAHKINVQDIMNRGLEHRIGSCGGKGVFDYSSSSNRFIWKCPLCVAEVRSITVAETIQLRAIYHLLNCHNNKLDACDLRTATDEKIKALEKELKAKLNFIPKTQADIEKLADPLDCINSLSITDERIIKCYNNQELFKSGFFCVCFCYKAVSGTQKSMIYHLKCAHGITVPRSYCFDIIERRRMGSKWSNFLWKCVFCRDCPARPQNSQLMAALSLRAHLQLAHIANGGDNAAKITKCWNDFMETLPCAEALCLCESYMCNGGTPNGNDSDDEVSELAVECFLCGSSVLGFFNDEVSLAAHILKYHSTFEKGARRFLLERRELEEIFPFLSVTDNTYFSTWSGEKQLRCSKCSFSCRSLKWLCVHASFHCAIDNADFSLVEQVDSTLKHFVVADPVLERFLLDSLHRNHNDHHNGHLCRICFRDLLSEEEEIIKHYWMKHPEELGIIAKFLQSEECERKASIER